jgi:uncharacterized protein YlxP (DUF503 family)
MVGMLTIRLHLPGCNSLKEKRGRLQPMMARLRRKFNLSVAEIDLQNAHQETIVLCAMVNSNRRELESSLQSVAKWVEGNWPDGDIIQENIELI